MSMHNEILSIQPSPSGQETQYDTHLVLDDSDTQNTANNMVTDNKFKKYSINRYISLFSSSLH